MIFEILTLFPEMFTGPFTESMLKRAQDAGLLSIHLHNIRDHTTDKHHVTDDTPFGGGGGMVMKAEPLLAAIESARADSPVILMTPQGRPFTQGVAGELSQYERLVIVCGRYEGVDERARDFGIDDEISIGDFVLTGGELPAMILVDAIARLIPGVLGAENGAAQDSYATGLLEHPHYTRPAELRGASVPAVLLEGHHAKIDAWRRRESLRRTWQRRPDLLLTASLSKDERWFLADLAESHWVKDEA
jgi:tRNA (guanine37-N1)-methyltransferase